MDIFVPVIIEPSSDAIKSKFPHKTLTQIEGEPTYEDFHLLREESFPNTLSSKSLFGGGDHGHKGACTTPIKYTIETDDTAWNIPATQGIFQPFLRGRQMVKNESSLLISSGTKLEPKLPMLLLTSCITNY